MFSLVIADFLLLLHLLFILFVILGGLLVMKWQWLALLHLPAAAWGALIEFRGWVCPLTPLENAFRAAAGEAGYSGGFIQHYLLPLIYPGALTREVQMVLGALVVLVNLFIYGFLLVGRRRKKM